jgi:hypothetical protein
VSNLDIHVASKCGQSHCYLELEQLQQQSNTGNILCFACNEINACKHDEQKNQKSKRQEIVFEFDEKKKNRIVLLILDSLLSFKVVGNLNYFGLWLNRPELIEMKIL